MELRLDTKTIVAAAATVGALIALGGYGAQGLKSAVTYVGGKNPPYASEQEEVQVAAQAQTLSQTLKGFQADQAKLQDNIDLLTLESLREEAKSADARAALHPHDASAKADAWFARKRMEIFFKAHPSLARALGGVGG